MRECTVKCSPPRDRWFSQSFLPYIQYSLLLWQDKKNEINNKNNNKKTLLTYCYCYYYYHYIIQWPPLKRRWVFDIRTARDTSRGCSTCTFLQTVRLFIIYYIILYIGTCIEYNVGISTTCLRVMSYII